MSKRARFNQLVTAQQTISEGFFGEVVALGEDIARQMAYYHPNDVELFGDGIHVPKSINYQLGRMYPSLLYSVYVPRQQIRLYILDRKHEALVRSYGAAHYYNHLKTNQRLQGYRERLVRYHYKRVMGHDID